MQRHGLSMRSSKRMFSATGSRTKKINTMQRPMRGGYRI